MKSILRIAAFITPLVLAAAAFADNQPTQPERTIRIEGRKAITVNTGMIRLSDIADVSSPAVSDDEKVIALKKIEIDPSPEAGQETTVAASRILERLQQSGVRVNDLVYVLPRVVSVKRASRALTIPELETAIKAFFTKEGRDVIIKNIDYRGDTHVLPSTNALELSSFNTARPQEIGFTVRAKADEGSETRFTVKATVDEWIEIPVAKRALPKGNEITADDVMKARLNLASLPVDAAREDLEIVGLKSNSEIAPGEIFRKNKLVVPPVVAQGSKVTLLYKNGLLEARATGFAMENGAMGQDIRVKNDVSKKIIGGRVLGPGLVGVN